MKSQAITEVRRLLEVRQRELKAELREIETALKGLGARRRRGRKSGPKLGQEVSPAPEPGLTQVTRRKAHSFPPSPTGSVNTA